MLIVRLGSLGDIIHALPVVQALRDACPAARIDWMVDVRQREILDLVPIVDKRLVVGTSVSSWPKLVEAVAAARRTKYDVAIDLQGLLKSAVLTRAAGARRVIGFSSAHLREPAAAAFYTERCDPTGATHVIEKNLAVLRQLGLSVPGRPFRFPLRDTSSDVVTVVRRLLKISPGDPFALVNCGGGWPNKRWPPEHFGTVAATLYERHGWRSVALWGPSEEALARAVVADARGAAVLSPPTTVADLVALAREARLIVSGDTGPLHIATAVRTPSVGIFGPTSPARNGSWSAEDRSLSRFETCICHHERRCRRDRACVLDISIDEVIEAVNARVAARHVR
ncbi:MAG: glycosyltransferase family 9 protein [Acidobacteria bacterium]|nr:glycosyltransferase family 9 protein [Acidobacteriota bacterium]